MERGKHGIYKRKTRKAVRFKAVQYEAIQYSTKEHFNNSIAPKNVQIRQRMDRDI